MLEVKMGENDANSDENDNNTRTGDNDEVSLICDDE